MYNYNFISRLHDTQKSNKISGVDNNYQVTK